MERKTPIPGERPYRGQRSGEEPDGQAPANGEYNRSLHRSFSFGIDSIIEDSKER